MNQSPPNGYRKATPEELKKLRPLIEKRLEQIRSMKDPNWKPVERTFSTAIMRKPWLDVGMEISCPNIKCNVHIAYVMKPLYMNERITSAHFAGPGIRFGAPMKCVQCGMPWCLPDDNFRIHTRLGWFPPVL